MSRHLVPEAGEGPKYPNHILSLIELGVPVLIYGKRQMVDRCLAHLRKIFPLKMYLPMALYIKPTVHPIQLHYRTVEHHCCVVADEKTIQGQVFIQPPTPHTQCHEYTMS